MQYPLRLIAGFVTLLLVQSLSAQVITWTPAYPTVDDSIVITFDATQGNAALNGTSPVFAHTGVHNQYSSDITDWQHIVSQFDGGFDSLILMTDLGNNRHEIGLRPRNFYGIGIDEEVRTLNLVFRNEQGTIAGKNADGSDIFLPIFPTSSFCAIFSSPVERPPVISPNDPMPLSIQANNTCDLRLFINGNLEASANASTTLNHSPNTAATGKYEVVLEADDGNTVWQDTIYYIVQPAIPVANLPGGLRDGINYVNDSTVVLSLVAPNKDYIYVIGEFNDWEMDPDYLMTKTPDGERHWLQINGLTPGSEVGFQYFVDHKVKVGDPWAEIVLDPFNDGGVNAVIYPNMPAYPQGKTRGLVTVMQPGWPEFQWSNQNFQRPDNRDLVIYELLVRDFVIRHDFKTVMDSLDYLQSLGINAIEFMPVNEFDGNQSWGYGPAYYCAPDKYYGPKERLKELIDACHDRGIAVIMDVVFNHAFSQNPNVQLYFDKGSARVTPDNPWFNTDAPHPLGLGYDFDHASLYTQGMIDSVLSFWVDEYKVDGFRFDLSKGFTNRSTGNLGDWSAYDSDRIFFLKRFANVLWPKYPGTYMILEHFGANDEETELANFGFMFWGNANEEYAQGLMGYEQDSDFSFDVSYQARSWAFHNLIGYMESHDEERLMYKNITFGNAFNTNHNCMDTTVALERMGMGAALFFTIPGPKMIWQFGEFGYDYSIDFQTRTGPKPVRWDYLNDPRRLKLKKIYAALIKLKVNYPTTFQSNIFDISAWGKQKQVHVSGAMDVTVCANFDVVDQNVFTGFQHTGWWYEYLSGDSLNVIDVNMTIPLQPGEYRVFTDERLPVPDLDVSNMVGAAESVLNDADVRLFPNPTQRHFTAEIRMERSARVDAEVYNLQGVKVLDLGQFLLQPGQNFLDADVAELATGTYLLKLQGDDLTHTERFFKQ